MPKRRTVRHIILLSFLSMPSYAMKPSPHACVKALENDPTQQFGGEDSQQKRNFQQVIASAKVLDRGASLVVYDLENGQVAKVLKNKGSEESQQALWNQVSYMNSISTEYKGKAIAPKPKEFLYDEHGKIVGYIEDKYQGRDFNWWLTKGNMNRAQATRVLSEVEAQLKLLHADGHIHGDINIGNIIVHMQGERVEEVKLVDFEPPNTLFNRPVEEMEMFNERVASFARFFTQDRQ